MFATIFVILAVVVLLIGVNGLYVAAEFSSISARRPRLAQLADEGNALARYMLSVIENPKALDIHISACQLGITLSSLLLGFFGQAQILALLQPQVEKLSPQLEVIISSILSIAILLVLSVFQVILGELMPKSVGLQHPEQLAIATAPALRWSGVIFRPLIFLFNGSAQLLLRLMGSNPAGEHSHLHSPEEILILVEESSAGGVLDAEERRLLVNTLQLRKLTARKVMIPRIYMLTAPIDKSSDELLELLATSPYSRLPLYEETVDTIIGVIHVKDLIQIVYAREQKRNNALEPSPRQIMHPVIHIPDSAPVEEVMEAMQKNRINLAIVINEYGGTAGMITFEDLVEEIFGEFQDEFDLENPPLELRPNNRARVRGDLLIEDLNETLDLNFPSTEADTVGGLVLSSLGHIPVAGDIVLIGQLPLRVDRVVGNSPVAISFPLTAEQTARLRQSRGRSLNMIEFLIPILIIIVLIFINGFFVAAEFAIAGASRPRVAALAAEGSTSAQRVLGILNSHPAITRYLGASQIGITLASLGLGMYGEHEITHWILLSLHNVTWLSVVAANTIATILAVAFLTYLHVVLGEMIPKSLALQSATTAAIKLSTAMAVTSWLFLPITTVLNWIGNSLLQLLGIPVADAEARMVSTTELAYIVEESSEGGLIDPSEQVFLENVIDFNQRKVNQIMTPRTRMAALPADASRAETLALICEERHSRYPVYEEDRDHILGILHVKDVARRLISPNEAWDLLSMLRPAVFVPESISLDEMLAQFRAQHFQVAIVVDEYGGTAGIVTLEDLAEEIVGEIQDEFDEEQAPFVALSENMLRVRGDLLLDELTQHYDLDFRAEEAADAETVGGLIMSLLGHVAQEGEETSLEGTRFIVEGVDGLAITTALIHLPTPTAEQDDTRSDTSSSENVGTDVSDS